MGVRDAKLIFSDAQEETTAAAHDSDNIIDLGANGADYGALKEAHIFVRVNETVTSGGAATVAAKLQDSADASSWADVNNVAITATGKATLVSGYYMIRAKLPRDLRRYLKIVYTIGTAALTAGSFDAWIDPFGDPDVT